MIAEYERAKILERSRRGKRHGAQIGAVSVLSGAPYGYRYESAREGEGEARFEVVLEEARVVRQRLYLGRTGSLFHWRSLSSLEQSTGANPYRQNRVGSGDSGRYAPQSGLQRIRGLRQDPR